MDFWASQRPLLLDGLLRAKREKGCEKKGFRVHAIDYEIYESKYMLFRKKTQANSGKVRNNRFGISEKKKKICRLVTFEMTILIACSVTYEWSLLTNLLCLTLKCIG